jgi:hypothetical protein
MKNARIRTFKVVLLIDGVETEVMFIEAASHRDAGQIVSAALIDGKSYEREKWALQITNYSLPAKTYVFPHRKKSPGNSSLKV